MLEQVFLSGILPIPSITAPLAMPCCFDDARGRKLHIECALRDQSSSLGAFLLVEDGGCTLRITRLYLRIGGFLNTCALVLVVFAICPPDDRVKLSCGTSLAVLDCVAEISRDSIQVDSLEPVELQVILASQIGIWVVGLRCIHCNDLFRRNLHNKWRARRSCPVQSTVHEHSSRLGTLVAIAKSSPDLRYRFDLSEESQGVSAFCIATLVNIEQLTLVDHSLYTISGITVDHGLSCAN
ncbi:hypothetical protein KC337_g7 [Hortaea werneckii]|nr:hypothetical protein KC337_g7 [Hortaea werneckii]